MKQDANELAAEPAAAEGMDTQIFELAGSDVAEMLNGGEVKSEEKSRTSEKSGLLADTRKQRGTAFE